MGYVTIRSKKPGVEPYRAFRKTVVGKREGHKQQGIRIGQSIERITFNVANELDVPVERVKILVKGVRIRTPRTVKKQRAIGRALKQYAIAHNKLWPEFQKGVPRSSTAKVNSAKTKRRKATKRDVTRRYVPMKNPERGGKLGEYFKSAWMTKRVVLPKRRMFGKYKKEAASKTFLDARIFSGRNKVAAAPAPSLLVPKKSRTKAKGNALAASAAKNKPLSKAPTSSRMKAPARQEYVESDVENTDTEMSDVEDIRPARRQR